ncbi:4'-phosphopantetheinyl transferase superfamily protein [Robertkochia solimangrovi]|uniref:4'-phosphopantetheinyl transferase superfamily protein n=1 Tax=Robertkochia solimangrovi TaxID=2213046 RepID=UPI0011807ED7|nr:4'-phosphopantetheinyl transferase superfamily protein [Robertkochia solimangrovi]TRZ46396.1 4-phosphopantetheinyl transferase [Robertkochia solimangrovi]
MPLYKTITVNPDTKVLIWKIEESVEALYEDVSLTDHCRVRLSHMKSELHQRGFLSVRHLLKAAGYSPDDLYYDSSGKPHLTDDRYISITHSFIFSGIIISKVPSGIDIEKQREKISVIAHKFVDYEYNYLDDSDVRRLTVVWCIKESLYKVFATEGMSFKQHARVIPFDLDDSQTTGWVQFRNRLQAYEVSYLEFEGFTCAYALEK